MTDAPDDLVERLRASASIGISHPHLLRIADNCIAAAAELTRLRERVAELEGENAQWHGLHRVIAEELGSNPEAWPDHRNAPLAIVATLMLHKQRAECAELERETQRDLTDEWSCRAKKAEAELAAARLELESLRSSQWQQDAERYRWLRVASNSGNPPPEAIEFATTPEQLDAAIDAARAGSKSCT